MDALPPPQVVLPRHLPAHCFVQSAGDYRVPEIVLVAMVKVESNGKARVARNTDGSSDIGVAQHNTRSWVPYLATHYGIAPEALATNPCQSIRAAAFVLRKEMNHRSCAGVDVWCGVKRYHAPNNTAAANAYLQKVQVALSRIIETGSF